LGLDSLKWLRRAFGPAVAALVLAATPVAAQETGAASASTTPCCTSLDEVRANIDRIDAAMIALMAERGKFVAEAGRFKPTVASVHDGARVERIIVRVRKMAAEKKLSPDVAEATYRAMIAAFTEYEKDLVAKRAQ
jgi:isochorismate pyruvate lyase